MRQRVDLQVLLVLLTVCGACTTQAPRPEPASAAEPAAVIEPVPSPQRPPAYTYVPPTAFQPGVELPAGQGRDIIYASCLSCHELTALALFKGFYTRDSWRDLVLTMKENGAAVDDTDVEVLADYLSQYFGPDS